MVTQALWQRDPVLMQLPHFSRELATACAEKGARLLRLLKRAAASHGWFCRNHACY